MNNKLFMILTDEHYYDYDYIDNHIADVVLDLDTAKKVVNQRIADIKEDKELSPICCLQIEVFEAEFVDGILEPTTPVYKYDNGTFYRTIQFEDDNNSIKTIYVDDSNCAMIEEYDGKLYKTIDNIDIYKFNIVKNEFYLAFTNAKNN